MSDGTHIRGASTRVKELIPVTNQTVPFDRSYWVVPGKLLAGCYPGAVKADEARAKLAGLVGAGIRTFVNLMEEAETDNGGRQFVPYEPTLHTVAEVQGHKVSVLRIPIHDLDVPLPGVMGEILARISSSILSGRPVFVHCWGGRGRTGTVVGCYMLQQGLATGSSVLGQIRGLRSKMPEPYSQQTSPETSAQQKFVLDWLSRPR